MYCQNCGMLKINCICGKYNKSDINRNENHEINEETKTDFSSDIVENESQVNSKQDKIQRTIKENFPFSTFLKDQLEILTEIVEAIEDGYKYIILESGVGKSAIAATLANIYESSFILSDNKKLQEKYHEEYDLINNGKFYVSNHSDAFNEFEKLDKRKLLIVDDAHKFDENIVDFFSCAIHLSDFDDELIDSFYCDVRDMENKEVDVWLDFINHLSLDGEKVNRVKYNIKENSDDWLCFHNDYWGYEKIIFKPLNLGNILKKYLLNKAETYIFMSSTILNKEIFAGELGLDISEVKFIHKDFPFSSDTNQIYLRNCADMKNFQNVKLVSPFIEDILEKHKNDNGIIHTDKPRVTNYIKNQIDNPRLMFHRDYDYGNKLKKFKNSSNSVLVSDSRVEDMAFPKDSCRFQIILRQHLLQKDKRADYKDNESNWYSYKKAIYLVQLLQRATRSEDDHCINYILDERISKTIRKDIIDYNFIPDYILDSIADMDIEGCELISDNIRKQFGVYYLFDYDKNTKYRTGSLSKKLLNYKDYSDDSIDYKDEFDYFNNELMKALSVLSNQVIPNNISKLALVSVPSSTVERDALATMRKSINCIENWYDEGKTETDFCCKKEIINCGNLLTRISDVRTSHLSKTQPMFYDVTTSYKYKSRPSYIEHKNSIECSKSEILERDDVAFIILDDISTRGTVMDACEDILIDNGANKENIYKFALFKTKWCNND